MKPMQPIGSEIEDDREEEEDDGAAKVLVAAYVVMAAIMSVDILLVVIFTALNGGIMSLVHYMFMSFYCFPLGWAIAALLGIVAVARGSLIGGLSVFFGALVGSFLWPMIMVFIVAFVHGN